MTAQSTTGTAGSRHRRTGAAGAPTASAAVPVGTTLTGTSLAQAGLTGTGSSGTCPAASRPTRTVARVRGRALLAALGLAVAAAVLPATAVHASPQSPDADNQLTNPGGNPQPPEPPDPPQRGPQDLANPTEDPEPPLPPDPPDVPDWGPDDVANPTEDPDPPLPPDGGPDDVVNPTENLDPSGPNPTGDPDPVSLGDRIPTPQRVDAGFGGTAVESHLAAGAALVLAAVVLSLLLLVIARRHRAEAQSQR